VSQSPWGVEFSAHAGRDLRRLDPQVRSRVVVALERLAANDRRIEERRIRGLDEWRIRVGDWRVRFIRDDNTRTIYVTHVLPRGRAYDR
jgi:mRNA interferase RelE/StbE